MDFVWDEANVSDINAVFGEPYACSFFWPQTILHSFHSASPMCQCAELQSTPSQSVGRRRLSSGWAENTRSRRSPLIVFRSYQRQCPQLRACVHLESSLIVSSPCLPTSTLYADQRITSYVSYDRLYACLLYTSPSPRD